MSDVDKLAMEGGKPVRTEPPPPRRLMTQAEKRAAVQLFDRAIESGTVFGYNGPEEQAFNREFVEYMGGGFADGVNSGTNAVFLALAALQLEAGSEVVIPPITDPGGAMPVAVLNCTPVQADSAPGSYCMGPEQLETAITERTQAVLVAHIAGIPADMSEIIDVARKHGLWVVEDAAQAFGARLNGQLAGTFGDIAAFSTMSGKHITTGGQGGVVYTLNEELHSRALRLADRGKPFGLEDATNVVPALNMNLTDLGAAIGRVQLQRGDDIVARRREIAAELKEGLADLQALRPMDTPAEAEPAYWFYPLHVDERKLNTDKNTFAQAVRAEGIPVVPAYRHIPAEYDWFRKHDVSPTPWLYKGRINPSPPTENVKETVASHFNLQITEGFDDKMVADTLKALAKVENAYLL